MSWQVTKSWQQEGADDSAAEVYTVLGAASDAEARQALAQSSYGVLERLSRYGPNPRLICQRVNARTMGVGVHEVRVEYVPSSGDREAQGNQPTTWLWSVAKSSEPIDRDEAGNPIVNSAMEPPENPPQRQFSELILTVRQVRSFYDPGWALGFMDHVNSANFYIAGKVVKKGCMLCDTIVPAGEQIAGQGRVLVAFTFRVRGDGWGVRFLDQGYQMRIHRDGEVQTPQLRDKDNAPLTKPALLNGRGGLLQKKDGALDFTTGAGTPTGATLTREQKAVFLSYAVYPEANFAEMGLGL